jgi:hypothetical protein
MMAPAALSFGLSADFAEDCAKGAAAESGAAVFSFLLCSARLQARTATHNTAAIIIIFFIVDLRYSFLS